VTREVVVATADVVALVAGRDQLDDLVAGWLIAHAGGSRYTLRSYRTSIDLWLAFCEERGIDPLRAGKTDVDVWHRVLAQVPSARTGRTPAPATLASRVSAVSSFYGYLVEEEVLAAVPVRRSTRPTAPRESQTVGLSAVEAAALHARVDEQVEQAELVAAVDPAAGADAVRAAVLERTTLLVLLMQGLRIGELLSLTVGSLRYNADEPTMLVRGKGSKVREIAVAGPGQDAIDALLTARYGDAPRPAEARLLPFGTDDRARLYVTRMIQRVARAAGIRSHAQLSPHSMRHTCATLMLQRGVHPNVVRDFLGHASADTTARYDRARGAIERSAAAVRALTNLLSEQVTAGRT